MEGKERLEKARERIIETIAQNIHLYGLAPSAGRQYGVMHFHDEPLTLDEMTELLGMSKTSVSTSVRALSELKLVERAWKKGVRKDLYKVTDDWHQSFIDLFSIKWRRSISLYNAAIKKSLNEMESIISDPSITDDIKELAEEDILKLKNMKSYYDWLERLVDAFEDQEIFKLVPKNEEDHTSEN